MSEIVIKEFYDYNFIKKSMTQYGLEYNEDDYTMFDSMEKTCYGAFMDDSIIAFGCICHINGFNIMTYTWTDGTMNGKRGYAKGFNHILKVYKDLVYLDGARKLNKVRRLL